MLSFNQMDFLQELDKLMKKYHIDTMDVHNADEDNPYVAFYSNGEYLGISHYYHGDFHGIRTYQASYKITGGEATDVEEDK